MKMSQARVMKIAFLLPMMIITLLAVTPAHALPCPGPNASWSQCPTGGSDILSNNLAPFVDAWGQPATGPVVADDFMGGGQPITGVRWWGADAVNASSFWIAFWDDAFAESPGMVLQSYTIPIGDTGQQEVLSGIFEYFVDLSSPLLPPPFVPEAGVKYWLSIQAIGISDWGWRTSGQPPFLVLVLDPAERGDTSDLPYWYGGPIGGLNGPWVNMAFELTTAVPEPGTLLLLASGFAGVALWGRTRVKRSWQ